MVRLRIGTQPHQPNSPCWSWSSVNARDWARAAFAALHNASESYVTLMHVGTFFLPASRWKHLEGGSSECCATSWNSLLSNLLFVEHKVVFGPSRCYYLEGRNRNAYTDIRKTNGVTVDPQHETACKAENTTPASRAMPHHGWGECAYRLEQEPRRMDKSVFKPYQP